MIPMRSQITMVILYAMGYILVYMYGSVLQLLEYIITMIYSTAYTILILIASLYMIPMRSQITRVIMYTILLIIFD